MKWLFSAAFRLPQKGLIGIVKLYRLLLSPWLGNDCRFEPTCSVYAIDALRRHGAVAGTGLTVYRLVRCQPWCQGGHDPVPSTTLFTRLLAQVAPPAHPPSKEKTTA